MKGNIFSRLFVSSVGKRSQLDVRHAIAAPAANSVKLLNVEPATASQPPALCVVTDCQLENESAPRVIVLPGASPQQQSDASGAAVLSLNSRFSHLLAIGRQYHELARHAFVQTVQHGFYAYERHTTWRTCALAAAYAGAFGQKSVERPYLSRGQCVWRLSQLLGYDLERVLVESPEGRGQRPLADETIRLVDCDGWNREGIADWLNSIEL